MLYVGLGVWKSLLEIKSPSLIRSAKRCEQHIIIAKSRNQQGLRWRRWRANEDNLDRLSLDPFTGILFDV